jgi:hypothetical protein
MNVHCHSCGATIPQERLEAIPNCTVCVRCASKTVTKYRGAMVYDHKTAGSLAVFSDADSFNNFKSATDRKGQSSILRKQMDGGGRLM